MIAGSGYQLSDNSYQGEGVLVYQGLIIGPLVIEVALRNYVWDNPYINGEDTDGSETQ